MRIYHLLIPIILFIATPVFADKYFGIYPNATLAEVKSIYPNAQYTEIKPAWLQKDEKFIVIDGDGIEGTISIIFYNELELAKQALTNVEDKSVLKQIHENTISKYTNDPNADPWLVYQIRWTPSSVLTISKFAKRYGKPDKEELDESFNRYKVWEKSHQIKALVDDKDIIKVVIYSFTVDDYICESKWREGKACSPDNYNENKSVTSKKSKKRK